MEEQRKDPTLLKIIERLEKGKPCPPHDKIKKLDHAAGRLYFQWNDLKIDNQLLVRQCPDKPLQILIPQHLQQEIIQAFHDNPIGCHLGTNKT